MSRRTSKKPSPKRTNTNKTVNVSKMEQEILEAPAKFANYLNKIVASLKQKETRLQKAVNKNETQLDKARSRLKSITNKKELNKTKKMIAQSAKEIIS